MKSIHTSRRPALILASLVAASLPLLPTTGRAAAPAPGAAPAAMTVQFGDLNLHSQAGLDRLYQRIIAAATLVCGGDGDLRPLANWSEFRQCTRESIDHAVAAVGIPDLVALNARKTGRPLDRRVLVTKR